MAFMKTSVEKWQIIGAVFTLIIGTLLHFTYQWSGNSSIVGAVAPVNESTWEHLKLLTTPIIAFGILEFFMYGRSYTNFIPVKVLSILAGMLTVIVLFYTYTGIVGRHFLIADIAVFAAGLAVAYFFSAKFLQTACFTGNTAVKLGILGLVLIMAAVVVFTFYPPSIGLFADPLMQN